MGLSPKLFARKNRRNTLVLANPLGGVSCRQKGKLTDGLTKRMSRFLVFFAIHDQHIILAVGISFGDEMYFTFGLALEAFAPVRLS